MSGAEQFRIRIKPIRRKSPKAHLPAPVPDEYPSNLLAVFIAKDIMTSLRSYARSDLTYELGGVLVGVAGKSKGQAFIEILNFIPARKGVSRRASFEFTNEAQQQIHEEKEAQFPELKIVGLFHTHPGYGIFLSSADQFIDEHYFIEKFHVALVLDPTKQDVEAGVFVWKKKGERLRVPLLIYS